MVTSYRIGDHVRIRSGLHKGREGYLVLHSPRKWLVVFGTQTGTLRLWLYASLFRLC